MDARCWRIHPGCRISWEAVGLARLTFGLVVVVVIAELYPALIPLYSEEGVLSTVAERATVPFSFVGIPWLIGVWILAIFGAMSFFAGWCPRVGAAVTFLAVSVIHRCHPSICDASDTILRTMLFWFALVPSGTAYSLEERLKRRRGNLIRPPNRALLPAILAQGVLAWIYFASFVEKLSDRAWRDGSAVHYALSVAHGETRAIGLPLADAANFYVPATYGTLLLEGCFPFLVFLPFCQPFFRRIAIISGLLFHLGIALLLKVGNFPWVMISLYPLLFESTWAKWPLRYLSYEPLSAESIAAPPPRALNFLWVTLFASGIWTTLPNVFEKFAPRPPVAVSWAAGTLWSQGNWRMFVPMTRYDSWLEAGGRLADGTVVDVLRGRRGTGLFAAPPPFDFRWNLYLRGVAYKSAQSDGFARFACDRWNGTASGAPALEEVSLKRRSRKIPRAGRADAAEKTTVLAVHRCP